MYVVLHEPGHWNNYSDGNSKGTVHLRVSLVMLNVYSLEWIEDCVVVIFKCIFFGLSVHVTCKYSND